MLILLGFTSLVSLQAQDKLPLETLTTEWQLDKVVDGVQIYLKKVDCNDEANGIFQEMILVRFVNTTQKNLRLSWDMLLWYDGKCTTCESTDGEYHYVVALEAGGIKEGICTAGSPGELRFFVRFLNYDHIPVMTQYRMADFTVKPM
jgi:hypothetical protein